jgi:hypothetical protein
MSSTSYGDRQFALCSHSHRGFRICVKILVGVALRGHPIFRHLNSRRKSLPQRGVAAECHPYKLGFTPALKVTV